MISATGLAIVVLSVVIYMLARARAVRSAGGALKNLHSRPSYHGLYAAMWTALIGLGVLVTASLGFTSYVDGQMQSRIEAYQNGGLPDDAIGRLSAPIPASEALERLQAGSDARAAFKAEALQTFVSQRGGDQMVAEGVADAPLREIERDLYIADAAALAEGRTPSRVDRVRLALAYDYGGLSQLRQFAVSGLALAAALATAFITFSQVSASFRARNRSERFIQNILLSAAAVAIVTTLGIVLSLVGETLAFASETLDWDITKFFFGTNWNPLANQRASPAFIDEGDVGWLPLVSGTLMFSLMALLVAVPIGLMAAIYLSDYATPTVRAWAKPMLEILAGIPTVVYGFFAAITVAPFIRSTGEALGLEVASESALTAGIVMGIMIIPFISSLSDDVINAVPQSLRDGSYGLGATKAETIRKVILPAALPGIISAVILGVSRAIGETMIVVMAAGQGPNLTANPLEAMTTVTVQIVQLIVGDTEADLAAGPAFTLGFALFTVTLILNIIALRIVRKYRELYD